MGVCAAPPPAALQAGAPPLARVLTRPLLLAHFAAVALIFAGLSLNLMNLPLLLTDELRGNESHVGIAFAIGPIAEMPLMLWLGRLAARGHQATIIRIGVALGVAYFLSLAVLLGCVRRARDAMKTAAEAGSPVTRSRRWAVQGAPPRGGIQ